MFKETKCTYDSSKVKARVTGWAFTNANALAKDEKALTNAIGNIGPVAVGIYVNSNFQNYASGVFNDPSCTVVRPDGFPDMNHAVVAVGYGSDQTGGDFYLIKNSWGFWWGENGNMKIARNRNNMCNIASQASYPIGV